jgi:cell division protein FtsN
MIKRKYFLLLPVTLLMIACSSGEKATEENQQKQPEIYVFDDIQKVDTSVVAQDTIKTEPSVSEKIKTESVEKIDTVKIQENLGNYIVQVGAFSTKERAETFIKENQSKVDYKMTSGFNDQTKLYVVQLPPFHSRESAEEVRNSIRQIPVFKGAFIISIEK